MTVGVRMRCSRLVSLAVLMLATGLAAWPDSLASTLSKDSPATTATRVAAASESRTLPLASVMDSLARAQNSRFSLNAPSAAATLYEQALAAKLPPEAATALQTYVRLAYADLARFDLRDPVHAIRLLRETTRALVSARDINNPLSLFAPSLRRWIDAEIAFLETQRRAAVPKAADCAPFDLAYQFRSEVLFTGNEPLKRIALNGRGLYPALSREGIASALGELSPSAINLLGASDALPTLGSSDRMLAFARKHDPAGFVTACILWRLRGIALITDKARREAAFAHYRWTSRDVEVIVSTANRVLGPVARR